MTQNNNEAETILNGLLFASMRDSKDIQKQIHKQIKLLNECEDKKDYHRISEIASGILVMCGSLIPLKNLNEGLIEAMKEESGAIN